MAKTTAGKPEDPKVEAPVAKPEDPKPEEKVETVKRGNIQRVDVRDTGLADPDKKGRFVRVLQKSYVNGAVFEKGEITHWPAGVETLGSNLEPYER
jgi:hypothetical protein